MHVFTSIQVFSIIKYVQLVFRNSTLMYPRIDFSIRFSFALFETYASFTTIPPPDGSRGPKELIHTLSPLTISFSIM